MYGRSEAAKFWNHKSTLADLSRYLDDVAGMIPQDGQARLVLGGREILDGNSRIILEVYDDAGNVSTYTKIPDNPGSGVSWMTLRDSGGMEGTPVT